MTAVIPTVIRTGSMLGVKCASCNTTITREEGFFFIDGRRYHAFCGADENVVQACTGCFMIDGCQCDC